MGPRVVAETFDRARIYLTAEEIYLRAGAGLPGVSRTTVYNTFGELFWGTGPRRSAKERR